MKKKIKFYAIILMGIVSLNGFSQEEVDSSYTETISLKGWNMIFSVKEPRGWTGDTVMAHNYYANIVFYETTIDDVFYDKTIIQVYNFKNQDGRMRVREELDYEISNFKKEHKKLELQDFTIINREFPCFSKLVIVKDTLYQYLAYLDPGKRYKSGFSVSMGLSKPATEQQMKAYRKIISSLHLVRSDIKKKD